MPARSLPLLLIFLPLITGVSSCQQYRFGPVKQGSSNRLEFHDNSTSGLMGEAEAALYENGDGGVVGFEHFFDGGNRFHNNVYRAAVRFNVAPLSEPPTKKILGATLLYTFRQGRVVPGDVFVTSCATQLLLATGDWKGIPEVSPEAAPPTIEGTVFKDLPGALLGGRVSVDVTSVVKEWASGARPNFGFVIKGAKEDSGLFRDNNACWSILDGFVLQVDYETGS